jgi:hypothetical protein
MLLCTVFSRYERECGGGGGRKNDIIYVTLVLAGGSKAADILGKQQTRANCSTSHSSYGRGMVTLQNRMHVRMREVFPPPPLTLQCLNSFGDFFFSAKREINVRGGKKLAEMLAFVIVEFASHTLYYKRFPW